LGAQGINYALNACIQHYEETGKSLKFSIYKGILPQLKVEHPWQNKTVIHRFCNVAINLDRAYKNFFEGRTKFPSSNQSWISSLFNTANVTVVGDCLNIPKIELLKQYSIDLLRET